MGMPAIEVSNLQRAFSAEVLAVAGIDLEVDEGEIYAFLGPNGAGKTTTVRMLTTLLRPTGGSARVAGHDVVEEPAAVRSAIGVALQEAALDPLMTGRELIRMQATLHGIARDEGRRRADDLLRRVGLTEAGDRRVGTYSGGMKRRLDLASSLVHEPRVLFLDEPTTGLDPVSRKAIWEEVEALNREGTTVFLTTQYLEEADQLADRVGTYSGGMKRRLDLASALVHEPRVLFLDEPTTGLDPVSRKSIWEEVEALNREGTTVFLTTQYLEEADQLANRVGIIDFGRIVAEDTPTRLKAQIGQPHLEIKLIDGSAEEAEEIVSRFGKPLPQKDGAVLVELEGGAAKVAPVVRALDEAGLGVEALDLVEPTLDDVFLEKTGHHLEPEEPDTGEERVE
jgi:ABC-type multidrug transport system ATPase subunit